MFRAFDENAFWQAVKEKNFLRLKVNTASAMLDDPTFERGEAEQVLKKCEEKLAKEAGQLHAEAEKEKQKKDDDPTAVVAAVVITATATVVSTATHQTDDPKDTGAAVSTVSKQGISAAIITATVIVTSTSCATSGITTTSAITSTIGSR